MTIIYRSLVRRYWIALAGESRLGETVGLRGTMLGMAARLHDPGGVFLRRSLRVAILLPLIYFFVYQVMGLQYGAALSAFTVYALLDSKTIPNPSSANVSREEHQLLR